MSFLQYPEHKDSGVQWLGKVPSHWNVGRLKHLLRIRGGQDYKAVESNEPTEFPVIGSGGPFTYATDYLYSGESVLLGRKGTIDKPLYVRGKFWTVDTMFYTEVLPGSDGRYAFYLATIIPFGLYSTNTALPSMSQFDLANHEFPLPDLTEQTQIARFLDHETAKIDALIREQERLIELLQEKRQAVISHAVTKGLDPDVPMKDSGVEWLGEVPVHWSAIRVKQVAIFITSGPRGWSDFIEEHAGDVFLQSGDLNDDLGLQLETAKRVNPPQGAEGVRTRLRDGDVVVCITGANTGRVAVVEELKRTTFINQHLSLIRTKPERINAHYLALCLSSTSGRAYFNVAQYGLKEGLSLSNVSEAPLALPPLKEQELIVRKINTLKSKFNALSDRATEQIELLQERRTALISATVTGKIDVRDWQPPADESDFDEEVHKMGMEVDQEVMAAPPEDYQAFRDRLNQPAQPNDELRKTMQTSAPWDSE